MSATNISQQEIKKLSSDCKLSLEPSEQEKFASLLTDTLSYINVLDELDFSENRQTWHVTNLKNVFNEATTLNNQTLTQDQVLKNASCTKNGLIVTKGVFDDRS